MNWDSFASWVQSIPLPLQWALAMVGTGLGLGSILRTDAIIRGLRKWLWYQQRLVRRRVEPRAGAGRVRQRQEPPAVPLVDASDGHV